MLMQFTVANYRSIKDPVTLSLVASSDSEHPGNCMVAEDGAGLRLLKSAAIYGANAAGKSNLVKALAFMRSFVLGSSREGQRGTAIGVVPFRLEAEAAAEPSEFEVMLAVGGRRYVYGFTADGERVHEECLTEVARKPRTLFSRTPDGRIRFGEHWRGGRKTLEGLTRPNALFLSVAGQFNNETVTPVLDWFLSGLHVVPDGLSPTPRARLANRTTAEGASFAARLSSLAQVADLAIDRIELVSDEYDVDGSEDRTISRRELLEVREASPAPWGEWVSVPAFRAIHVTEEGTEVTLDLTEESAGTQRIVELADPWFQVIDAGGTLLVDEIERSLHPLLARYLIQVMHDSAAGQLVFTTHNTELLDLKLLRRDQVWFVEKDRAAASHLRSLWDYHALKGENVRRGYLEGRYGATPIIGGDDPWSPGR
jgi:uncharacterized protein